MDGERELTLVSIEDFLGMVEYLVDVQEEEQEPLKPEYIVGTTFHADRERGESDGQETIR